MGWWFGRKQAAPDVRPYVPAWLSTAEEEGFARSPEGMHVHVRSTGATAIFSDGAWTIGSLMGERVVISGNQVVGPRGAAIAGPAGGSTTDQEARLAIGEILSALRQHGLIAT